MAPKKAVDNNDIADKYKKMDQREHVLQRSNMYIGEVSADACDIWVFNDETATMTKKNVKYVPGLYKIFDEIIVNSIDHSIRLKNQKVNDPNVNLLKTIKVSIDKVSGIIEVLNDGDGIEIVKHPEHNIYIPEMIFGNMLTSTNYDDTEERTIGGLNGLGAKLTNIFSTWFEIETVDRERKLSYKQRFETNMSVKRDPEIAKSTKKPYTIIRFLPDYAKFGLMGGLTEDMFQIMKKRVYDACAVTDNDINIYLNDVKLDYKNFEKYVDLYIGSKDAHTRVFEKISEKWEICASYNNFNGFEQISFVNGIWTIRGGKHVEYIVNQIVKKLTDLIAKKKKDITVKPQTIKDNLILFVKSTIVNPNFDSQSKETLTTPSTKFGSKAEVSDKFIDKLYKSGIVEKILEISEIQDNKKLQKTDGKKKNTIRGLPKLEDANWAGTPKSRECTLILTEGDSAMSMAIAGISEVGRDKYGVFPLRGKLMNVKDQTVKKICENEEISNLKKILGLETGKEYKTVDDLRYGMIMILTDADEDGSHIKGLLFNMFHSMWPSLVKCNEFMTSMLTPIVKVSKGNSVSPFYNMTDYNNWMKNNNDGKGWEIKYYKGLGTSTDDEAKEYFRNMNKIEYKHTGEASDQRLDLAFNKKKADERKEWLGGYDRQCVLDYSKKDVTYEDFIDKQLIHFSNYDVERSIPNICDGLKVSQRKILFACFKKNLTSKEIKVAQLAGYVSENAAYHHGEASLQSAIVGMAQKFVGSNNINLLKPNGQFGTRRLGGKDAASPRYIFTLLEHVTMALFRKDDNNILTYLNDDGLLVEPEYYMPVLPTVLVNGALGIGTGFSTNIPCYNPKEIMGVVRKIIACEDVDGMELKPWYRGFNGSIEKSGDKYVSRGTFTKVTATKVDITELPVGMWIQDFKEFLEEYMDKHPEIKNYESHYTDKEIRFSIFFNSTATCDQFLKLEANGYTKLENEFKLVSSKLLGTSNMYLFNSKCQIQKYNTVVDIIKDWCLVRLTYYTKRKDKLLAELKADMEILDNKIRFIKAVVAEQIVVHKLKKTELEERLAKDKYTKIDDKYDYLLRIPIYNLTIDKVAELEAEKVKADTEYNRVLVLDVKDWWSGDLDEFSKVYDSFLVESLNSSGASKPKVQKRTVALKK